MLKNKWDLESTCSNSSERTMNRCCQRSSNSLGTEVQKSLNYREADPGIDRQPILKIRYGQSEKRTKPELSMGLGIAPRGNQDYGHLRASLSFEGNTHWSLLGVLLLALCLAYPRCSSKS